MSIIWKIENRPEVLSPGNTEQFNIIIVKQCCLSFGFLVSVLVLVLVFFSFSFS